MPQEIRIRFHSCGDKGGGDKNGDSPSAEFRVQLTDAEGNECGVVRDFAPFRINADAVRTKYVQRFPRNLACQTCRLRLFEV